MLHSRSKLRSWYLVSKLFNWFVVYDTFACVELLKSLEWYRVCMHSLCSIYIKMSIVWSVNSLLRSVHWSYTLFLFLFFFIYVYQNSTDPPNRCLPVLNFSNRWNDNAFSPSYMVDFHYRFSVVLFIIYIYTSTESSVPSHLCMRGPRYLYVFYCFIPFDDI